MKVFVINDIAPEFIEPQYLSFKKYLQEDFSYTVCCSQQLARKPEKAEEVMNVCRRLKIPVIEIKRDDRVLSHCNPINNPIRHTVFTGDGRYRNNIEANYSLQWTWEEVIAKQTGFVCFLHSDIFLTEPVRFSDYLEKYILASVVIQRVKTTEDNAPVMPIEHLRQLWEAFMLLDMSKLPEPDIIRWWSDRIDGTWMPDSGMTCNYLKAYPYLNIMEIEQGGYDDDSSVDFHPSRYQYLTLKHPGMPDKRIFHYMAGCRWHTDELRKEGYSDLQIENYHDSKLAWARKLINV